MSAKSKSFLSYVILFVIGTSIILIVWKFENHINPREGEYFYSTILRAGYTILSAVLFFAVGIITGMYSKLNPWLVGLATVFILPLVTLIEGTIYPGSHNLLPFELIVHFAFSLPAVIGVYVGRFSRMRLIKSK